MNRLSLCIAGGLALATTVPAHAEHSDRVVVEEMRARVAAVRQELGPDAAGSVELVEADNRLRDLFKALDNGRGANVRASVNGIEALIAAARVRSEAARRAPAATPTSWTPASPAAPVRKRIGYRKPARPVAGCRIASR